MLKAKVLRSIPLILPFLLLGCDDSSIASASVSYQPPFLPVAFEIDTNGKISIKGDLSIVTPIGTFSIAADASTSLQAPKDVLVLIIRHVKNSSVVDDVYDIQTASDEVKVVTNGRTTVDVTLHKVFIDATNGSIQSIEVTDANSASTNQQSVPDSAIPQLKASYSGTITYPTGFGNTAGPYPYTWNVNSQDQKGNIDVTITLTGPNIAGTVSFRKTTRNCVGIRAAYVGHPQQHCLGPVLPSRRSQSPLCSTHLYLSV